MLLILEALFVAALAAGVAMWSIPAALVVVGVLGVVACERASAERGKRDEKKRGES